MAMFACHTVCLVKSLHLPNYTTPASGAPGCVQPSTASCDVDAEGYLKKLQPKPLRPAKEGTSISAKLHE